MKYPIPALLSLLFLAGCSDYKAPDLQPVKEKTYTGDKLVLYYNGYEMPNKSVTLNQTGDKATAKLFATFDLSQLSALGLSGSIPAPGILPGSSEAELQLTMHQDDEYWNFSGSGDSKDCTFSYAGYANDDRMALFLSDVKLKTPGISPQVWKPSPIKMEDGIYTSIPFFIDWQYDPIPDVDINLSPYLEALTTLPLIPVYNNTAYMSISQAMALMVQTIAFKDDGNLLVSYISSTGGASRLAQTLPNRFMYTVDAPGKISLYINPTALFGMILVGTSSGTPADDIKIIGNGIYPSGHVTPTSPGAVEGLLKSEVGSKIAKAALSVILPRLTDGLPLDVSEADGVLHICLDTPVAVALMQEIMTPLLQDSEAVKAIEDYIESNPTLKPMLPLASKAMQLLPEAIERTNHFQIGLSLTPYQE